MVKLFLGQKGMVPIAIVSALASLPLCASDLMLTHSPSKVAQLGGKWEFKVPSMMQAVGIEPGWMYGHLSAFGALNGIRR